MRLAIYGAGAMGTILGAYLAKSGENIDLISRNEAHIEGLKNYGAHIIGKIDFTQKVNALLPQDMAGKYDIIFLMTKQMDNLAVVKGLTNYLASDGVICTMQNGLPELSVAKVIGENRTIGCAMAWGATMIGKGIVELTSEASRETLSFSLGTLGSQADKHFFKVVKLLEIMGDVKVEDNFIGARWAKLLVNSAFSGLSAVLGATFGEIATNKKSRVFVQKIAKECIEVTKKAKIRIEPIQGKDLVKLLDYNGPIKKKISFMIIPLAIKKHRLLKSSMLQDLEKGRRCEIEAINGVVCASGDKVNLETPVNDRIVKIVHEIENGKYKSRWQNLELFKDLL